MNISNGTPYSTTHLHVLTDLTKLLGICHGVLEATRTVFSQSASYMQRCGTISDLENRIWALDLVTAYQTLTAMRYCHVFTKHS